MKSKDLERATQRPNLSGSVFALFGLLLMASVIAFAGSAGATGQAKESAVPCGPQGAKTLAVDDGVRIFRNGPAGSGKAPSRVCHRSSVRAVTLGHGAAKAPFAIKSPWAGGVEANAIGQDSVEVSLVGVDVESRDRATCLVGRADRPGQLPKVHDLWVAGDGSLVATVTLRLPPAGPLLAVCRPEEDALEVLARGSAVALSSVKVKGNFVFWTEEGHQQSEQV